MTARGLRVDDTGSFERLFKGDDKLETVDISNWVMVTGPRFAQASDATLTTLDPSVTDMFTNCASIRELSTRYTVKLDGSGLNRKDGMWATGNFTDNHTPDDTLWFLTSERLRKNYPSATIEEASNAKTGSIRFNEHVVYYFVKGSGNMLHDNQDAAWAVVLEDTVVGNTTLHANEMYIGVRPEAENKEISGMRWRPWGPYTEKVTDIKTYGLLSPRLHVRLVQQLALRLHAAPRGGRVPDPCRESPVQRLSVLRL